MEYSVYASGIQSSKNFLYLVQTVDYELKFCIKKTWKEYSTAKEYFEKKIFEYSDHLVRKSSSLTDTIFTFYKCSYFYGKNKVAEVSLSALEY